MAYRNSDWLIVPEKSMKVDGGKGRRIIASSKRLNKCRQELRNTDKRIAWNKVQLRESTGR